MGVAVLDLFISIVIIFSACCFGFGEVIDEDELRALHGYKCDNEKSDNSSKEGIEDTKVNNSGSNDSKPSITTVHKLVLEKTQSKPET